MVIQFATGSGTTNKKGVLFRFCENDQTPEVNTIVSGYNTKTLRSKCYSSYMEAVSQTLVISTFILTASSK